MLLGCFLLGRGFLGSVLLFSFLLGFAAFSLAWLSLTTCSFCTFSLAWLSLTALSFSLSSLRVASAGPNLSTHLLPPCALSYSAHFPGHMHLALWHVAPRHE